MGDADRPPPTPRPRPCGPLPPPAGGSWGQVGAPGPGRAGSGVGGSCQCGGRGRGASGRRGRLLITRPPSPGSRSHGQPGAPARRGRRRPGREVGPCRARVAVLWGGGAGRAAPRPPASTFLLAGGGGPAGVWRWHRAEPPAEGDGRGPGSRHLRLSVAFYSGPHRGWVRINPFRPVGINPQMPLGQGGPGRWLLAFLRASPQMQLEMEASGG